MRKERYNAMILSATTAASSPGAGATKRPPLAPLVVLALIVIVVVVTGIAYAETATGPTGYACMSITHQGSDLKITTTGLLHYVGSAYYISCNEGSSLPTSTYKSACLTISPRTILAPIGVGASTEYYYISSGGSPLTLQGAPTPVNATEFINPAGISLTAAC